MPRTVKLTVPDVVTRKFKLSGSEVVATYNSATGEVVCTVDGMKLMEQPEEQHYRIRTLMKYWEGYVVLHGACNAVPGLYDCAPIEREAKGIQVRINAKSDRLAAKRNDRGDSIHQVGGSN